MKKLIIVCFYAGCSFFSGKTALHAQTINPVVINTAGGFHSFGYINISWSIGEMPLVHTATGSTYVVTNGFLQPYSEKPGDIDNNSQFNPDEILVFPNPATDYIEINFFTRQKGTMAIRLYNGSGQLSYQKQFHHDGLGRIERIDLQRLPPAEYFLQVMLEPDPGSVAKKGGYKIIKLR